MGEYAALRKQIIVFGQTEHADQFVHCADRTIATLDMDIKSRDKVIDAAIQVSTFVKNNEYPVMGSPEQGELTMLLNNQDTAIRLSQLPELKEDKLSDEKLLRACRDAGFENDQWAAMTYESGKYEITRPGHALRKLATILINDKEK